MIRAIVSDIEGTTSSLAFVKDVLFPYARARMAGFIRTHGGVPEVRRLLQEVSALSGAQLDDEQAIAQLLAWIDEDSKKGPLKALQGLIWEAGYQGGDFQGHIYQDAMRKLQDWKHQGLALYIYSSGSVHAQKLLFGHTENGDLTPLFSGYFDTQIGSKLDTQSYRRIADQTGFPPGEILFLSDSGAELDAARAAGMKTCQLLREGTHPHPGHSHAADFDGVSLTA